ncbi:hypothetical protein F4824DRAFT_512851 [Ustulina deusta]|nr:hypothetical protein F4824DRAFT_512851 [Ustulina deusta]
MYSLRLVSRPSGEIRSLDNIEKLAPGEHSSGSAYLKLFLDSLKSVITRLPCRRKTLQPQPPVYTNGFGLAEQMARDRDLPLCGCTLQQIILGSTENPSFRQILKGQEW